MKEQNIMFTIAIASGIGLAGANLLTGERLNVLLLGFIPSGMAAVTGLMIRYVTKHVSVVMAE